MLREDDMRFDLLAGRNRFLLVGALLLTLVISEVANSDKVAWKYRFELADKITASGQPKEDGLKEIAEDGYVAVIDLRTASENRGMDEQGIVENLGMEYVALPISGRDAINFENAVKLAQILNSYDQPVLVHCGNGNRVGALLALREKINGASIEDALKFGKSGGMTTLEGVVKARLAED